MAKKPTPPLANGGKFGFLYQNGKPRTPKKPVASTGVPQKPTKENVAPVDTQGGTAIQRLTGGKLKPTGPLGMVTTPTQRIKQIQQILVNHGYDIKVDGVEGPETHSALVDFHSSKPNSKAWNAGHGAEGTAMGVSTKKVGTFSPGGNPPTKVTTAPVKTTTTKTTSTPSIAAQLAAAMKGVTQINPSKYAINPGQYATQQADTTYNPQIATANQDISDAQKQATIDLADLGKWYGDAEGLAKMGAVASAKDDQAAIQDNGAAGAGILAAFGGNAGSGGQSMANSANNTNTLLTATAQNNSSFNDMLQSMIANSAASAKNTQSNKDQTNIADMKSQLASLIAAKASAIASGTTSAKQQNLSNLIDITNANNSSKSTALNQLIEMATLPSTLNNDDLKGLDDQTLADSRVASANKASEPAWVFAKATPKDISSKVAEIGAAVKGLAQPLAIARAIKLAQPWKVSNPAVAKGVIIPALTYAGFSGITPAMLGINT